MKNACANCPNAACANHVGKPVGWYRKRGYYRPKHNHQPVPCYECRTCGRRFSSTQTKAIRQHHRPDLNRRVFEFAVSGASMRRMAQLLGCSKRTVQRKIEHLAKQAQAAHLEHLSVLRTSFVMMDELETFIHARYKQVSVPMVVRVKTGEILAFEVGRMPSKMKQGVEGNAWVHDDRPRCVPAVLASVAPLLKEHATIATDGATSYPKWVQRAMPGVQHLVAQSPKETNLGRSRKKASGEPRERDPLFAINLTFAKMRNDLARLGRKTWTTSKSIEGLRNHLWLYVAWVNGYKLK